MKFPELQCPQGDAPTILGGLIPDHIGSHGIVYGVRPGHPQGDAPTIDGFAPRDGSMKLAFVV
ncbi:MAG: hypothetical protein M3Z24_13230, partial [Chloroflexota bacterium]|nr:hypothetical protein [Chloroflexota bacterium]